MTYANRNRSAPPATFGSHRSATAGSSAISGLRVLLLNYEFPPVGGGAGVACEALARTLARSGAQVDVVTAAGTRDGTGERIAHADPASGGQLRVIRVRTRRLGIHQAGYGGAARYLFNALPVIRRRMRDPGYDIVHIFFSLPTGALLPLLPVRGEAVVVSLRGSDVPGYDTANRGLVFAHRLLRPVTRWIWRRADAVVALSSALGALALSTDPGLRFRVIHNGVDLELFHPAGTRDATSGPLRCLAVARLIERKGIDVLLRAWALLPRGRFSLEIVGDGSAADAFREMARALGVGEEVHFAGPASRDALADRYRAADVFVLTPRDEAFGNVFAESLASGLPIVASRVGGIPEFVSHMESGLLVPPEDARATADALLRLEGDPALRAAMATRNRRRAERELPWTHAAARYADLYLTLRGRKGGER